MKKNRELLCSAQLIICILLCMTMCMAATGCSVQQISKDKIRDIDYTVVPDADIPETLKNAIDEKKNEPFKLSYSDKEEMYIVVGYGEQMSGGYSIIVDGLYQTDNAVVFATTLKGPEDSKEINETPTYPYIVVKMEYIDCEVIYE